MRKVEDIEDIRTVQRERGSWHWRQRGQGRGKRPQKLSCLLLIVSSPQLI